MLTMTRSRNPRKNRQSNSARNSSRNQRQHQQLWLWGAHTVAAAINNPARRFKHLYATSNAVHHIKEAAAECRRQIEILSVEKLDRLLPQGAVHQGIAALADPLPEPDLDEIETGRDIVVLDQVTDPHNVGAIMRTACAFGISALIVTNRTAPTPTGVLAKAASGAIEHLPMVRVTNLSREIAKLNDTGYQTIGLSESAEGVLQDVRDQGASPRPVALVLGAEGKGLRELTAKTCSDLARLDLPGPIKALNVSNAAAIALGIVTRAGQS